MSFKKKLKSLVCKHNWEKFMGFRNIGRGKFSQRYVCKKCEKMREVVR
jgi:transposase-like protein|tara:strand:+ start:567 stop:710 length:144 start_codon:yes stop_codon:yes gene_type:complete